MLSWYALKTKPQRELVVRDQLHLRGIETFLPLWHPAAIKNAQHKLYPFFPTYLFADVDLTETSLSSLLYLPGMNHMIMCDGKPIQVQQSVIDTIAAQIRTMENSVVDAVGKSLLHGDKVRIMGGAFEGYEAIFDRYISSGDRVRLLIDFLQKQSPLNIERSLVCKQLIRTFSSQTRSPRTSE